MDRTVTDHGLELERPYKADDPLDMKDGREAARKLARMRRDAEAEMRRRIDERATKEGTYRQTLAKAIVTAKADHGASVARELAHEDAAVKKALVDFRVAEGMVDAMKERLRGLEGERSMLKSLIDWSATIANVLRQTSGESEDRRRETERPVGGR